MFVSFFVFWWEKSSRYRIISQGNRDNLASICFLIVSFNILLFLIPLDRVLRNTLNKSGEGGHSILYLILEEILSVFFPFNMMLALGS